MRGLVHAHPHAHPHGPDVEGGWEPSGPGSVLLDIDQSVGALVVLVPPEWLGREIEAEPAGGAGAAAGAGGAGRPLVHTAVRERPLPGGALFAAFFPSLAPGEYRMRLRGGGEPAVPAVAEVRVAGGAVTQLDLRA